MYIYALNLVDEIISVLHSLHAVQIRIGLKARDGEEAYFIVYQNMRPGTAVFLKPKYHCI